MTFKKTYIYYFFSLFVSGCSTLACPFMWVHPLPPHIMCWNSLANSHQREFYCTKKHPFFEILIDAISFTLILDCSVCNPFTKKYLGFPMRKFNCFYRIISLLIPRLHKQGEERISREFHGTG